MKTIKPKTIQEAIDNLQMFLESDLYSNFRPEKFKGDYWYSDGMFKSEKDMIEYLRIHFKILEKEIKALEENKK